LRRPRVSMSSVLPLLRLASSKAPTGKFRELLLLPSLVQPQLLLLVLDGSLPRRGVNGVEPLLESGVQQLMPQSLLSNGKSVTMGRKKWTICIGLFCSRATLAVLMKERYPAAVFTVVGGKPCAINWSLLNRAPPLNFSDFVS
jgi:hypothetical protein